MSKQKSEDKLDASMRVLKTATCKTLSGKSTLTYHIGATPDSEVHFRIYSNSGDHMQPPEVSRPTPLRRQLGRGSVTTWTQLVELIQKCDHNRTNFCLN